MSETAVAYAQNGQVPPALVDNGEALPGLLRDDAYLLPAGLSFERWQGIGVTLQQMQRSINWWLGDWLRYGEANYGEDAYQAVKLATGRGDESLSQVTWVASRFPPSTRVPELSWSHHRAVLLDDLPIAESRALLHEAAESEDRVSVRELIGRASERQAVIRGEPPVAAASEPDPPPDPHPLQTDPPANAAEMAFLIADLAAFIRDEYLTKLVTVSEITTRHDRSCDFGKAGKTTCYRRCLAGQALLARAELM